jgi:hypothetical protein
MIRYVHIRIEGDKEFYHRTRVFEDSELQFEDVQEGEEFYLDDGETHRLKLRSKKLELRHSDHNCETYNLMTEKVLREYHAWNGPPAPTAFDKETNAIMKVLRKAHDRVA